MKKKIKILKLSENKQWKKVKTMEWKERKCNEMG